MWALKGAQKAQGRGKVGGLHVWACHLHALTHVLMSSFCFAAPELLRMGGGQAPHNYDSKKADSAPPTDLLRPLMGITRA